MPPLAERLGQSSAAKPRDLGQDLAIAAQHTSKKRRTDNFDDQEQAVNAADITQQPADTDARTRRHSVSLLARPRLASATMGRPGTAYTGRASISQPADALQYLANKGSKIQELEAELKLSQSEIISLSQQLEQATSMRLAEAESLATIQGERDFLATQRNQERLDMEHQLLQAEQKIQSLRQDLRHTEVAKTEAEEQAQLAVSRADSRKSQAADLAAANRQQLQQLRNELELAKHNAQEAEEKSTRHASSQQSHTESLKQQLELLRQQLRETTRDAELHNQRRVQAEEHVAALRLQESTASVVPSDDSILLQNLRDELAAQCADVAEARRLKGHVRNTEVLQEQLHAAQLRAEAAEQRAAQADQLSSQLAELQSHREVWDKVLQGLSGAETPENVLSLVDSLQTQVLKSAELLGDKSSEVATQAGELQQTAKELRETSAALTAKTSMCEQLSSSQARLERRVELLTKERDSLKQTLTLYQDEVPQPAAAGGTPQRAAQAAHIAQLEGTITDLRSQSQEGQQELASRDGAAEASLRQLTAAKQKAAEKEGSLQELQKVYEDQSRELALLQERLGKGEFNKATTRVLHFKRNPEAAAVEKMEQSRCSTLQAENAALKGQLQNLEGQSAAAASGSVDAAVKEAQITVLQHQVADLEKARTRLTQVFRAQVSGFREACYHMFGYRIDVTAEAAAVKPGKAAAVSLYTLTPQHADDAAAKLQFRMDHDQKLQLVTNKYVQSRLSKEVETFIDRFQSISAFTANYTMEQFQKQTQC